MWKRGLLMNKRTSGFESIIPTALMVAYPRIFTDIPYSKEIYSHLKEKMPIELNLSKDILAVELEARYKLMDKLLKQTNIKQVIELAAGYSPRGLIYTENNDYKYAELELRKVTDLKKKIIKSITNLPNNLLLISGSAIVFKDYEKCIKNFDSNKDIAIINEGLLRYLNFDEKRKVAENVFCILKQFGGIWITCDFTPKKFIQNQDSSIPLFNNELKKITDRNNANWRFESEESVRKFLNDIGFNKIEFHRFNEVKAELVSPNRLNIDDKKVNKLIDDAVVAVIKI